MKKSVFISHSSKDKRIADEICTRLEAASIGCWIAPRDVAPGTAYGEAIVKGIEGCSVCLLLLSENANRSEAVAKEVERAFSYQKLIVPLRVREVMPGKAIEFFIASAQWVDAFASPIADRIEYLAAVVQAAESREAPPAPAPQRRGFAAGVELMLERLLRYRLASAVGAVALLAALGTAGLVMQHSTQAIVQGAAVDIGNSARTVREAGQQIGAVSGKIDSIEAGVKEAKKETSADPRKELANLGVAWSVDNLREAMTGGDMRTLDLFLAGGMPVLASVDGCPALWFAIANNHNTIGPVIDMAVRYGLDVNQPMRCTPSASSDHSGQFLTSAILYRNGPAVKALLAHGAKVSAQMRAMLDERPVVGSDFARDYGPLLRGGGPQKPAELTPVMADGTVTVGKDGVVIQMKRGALSVTMPDGRTRPVAGDVAGIGLDGPAYIERGFAAAVVNSGGGTFCPGGYWHVIDLSSGRASAVKARDLCGEGSEFLGFDGTPANPVAFFRTPSGVHKAPVR